MGLRLHGLQRRRLLKSWALRTCPQVANLQQSEVAVEEALCTRAARTARIQRAAKKGDTDKQRKLLEEMVQQVCLCACVNACMVCNSARACVCVSTG